MPRLNTEVQSLAANTGYADLSTLLRPYTTVLLPLPLQVTVRQLDMKLASGLTTAAIEGLAATAHTADDPVRVTMCSRNEVYSDY